MKDAAEKIVAGEDIRSDKEGANYKPMALPSAAEVGALLSEFTAALAESGRAQEYTDQQGEELAALYAEAQALAVDICDTVEFFHRKDPDASSRRAKCQRWGVVYVYDDGTPVPDPDPAPDPAPTPDPVPNP